MLDATVQGEVMNVESPALTHTAQPRIDLGERVAAFYAKCPTDGASNAELYEALPVEFGKRQPVGRAGAKHDLDKRKVRWFQQTLKALGVIEPVEGKRGHWRCRTHQKTLDIALPGKVLISFSTDLGVALYADCVSVFAKLQEPIALCLTSPPYALARPRAYGNKTEREYVAWLVDALEPIIANLLPGGSLVLNVSNDIFERGSPARSTYLERLVLALTDQGLHLMDRWIWHNPCKPPGPTQWASRTRQQLNVAWEPVLWFAKNPHKCFADNRRVLEPHSEKHKKLLARGGENRSAQYGDGAYRIMQGSYGDRTEGRIPRNVLWHPTGPGRSYSSAEATALGLPGHGATMPLSLVTQIIRFLTDENADHLVADPFGGSGTTGLAAQNLGRRWILTEAAAQYSAASAMRFDDAPGFQSHHSLERA